MIQVKEQIKNEYTCLIYDHNIKIRRAIPMIKLTQLATEFNPKKLNIPDTK